jgi:hypothetical protein
MSFDAVAMLAGLYAETPAAVAILTPEPEGVSHQPQGASPRFLLPSLADDANEWYWLHLRDADRDYLLAPRDWPDPCPWCGGRLIHSPACNDLRREWVPAMPFGKHRGRRVDELPADYIDWLLAREVGSRAFREDLRKWRGAK